MQMKNKENYFVLYLGTRNLLLEKNEEINSAKRAGLDIVMAAPSFEPYKGYDFKHFIEAPLGKYEIAEKIIVDYLQSNNLKVEGVVAWGDKEVELAAKLGTTLGLPSSTPEAALNVRNKAETRRLLDQLDSVNPRYEIIRDYASFRQGLEIIGTPCLLKPTGSSFGRGIFKIEDYEKADSFFQQFIDYCVPVRDEIYSYFREEFILEEYLDGTEHSVAGIVADSQVTILAISDKKIDKTLPFQYENIVPSKLSSEIISKVVKISCAAVKLMGINWCGFHIDFMVTVDGIKILEIGGRLGGECINSHLIPLAYPPLQPYDMLLNVIQGNNPFTKSDYVNDTVNQAALRALLADKPGRIVRLDGFEQIKNYPLVREFIQVKDLNDEVVLPSVKIDGFVVGYFIIQCSKTNDIENLMDEIASFSTIEIE